MRNMSFALTEPQVLAQTKDVTRRMGWTFLKVGDLVQPVRKGMGLKPGEKIVKLGAPVEVVGKQYEPLNTLVVATAAYGPAECRREGFPAMTPEEFVEMFCRTHRGCTPERVITRIAFRYTAPAGAMKCPAAPGCPCFDRQGARISPCFRAGTGSRHA